MQSIEISYFKHPIYKDYASDENGNIYSFKSGEAKIINPCENYKGYLRFGICNNGKVKRYQVHRFVYECLNNRLIENEYEIDHLDKDKKNNSITNLRFVSRTTNILNRYENEEVDELPEDSIKIIKYNDHLFDNIYFSPSNSCLYKISEGYKFKIEFKKYQIKNKDKIYFNYSTQVRDINNKPVNICLNKLRKNLGY